MNPALPCFLRLAATTGARRGELCALRWSDVDFDRGELVIGRSMAETREGLFEKDTKTHAARRLSLDVVTVAALREQLAARNELSRQASIELSKHAFVFSRELDATKPWCPGYVTLAFRRLSDAVGLEETRLHDLRHFSATMLLTNGTDVRTVSGRLGHANPANDAECLRTLRCHGRPRGCGIDRLGAQSTIPDDAVSEHHLEWAIGSIL